MSCVFGCLLGGVHASLGVVGGWTRGKLELLLECGRW